MTSLRAHTTVEKLVGFLAHTAGLLPHAEPSCVRELLPFFSCD